MIEVAHVSKSFKIYKNTKDSKHKLRSLFAREYEISGRWTTSASPSATANSWATWAPTARESPPPSRCSPES